MGKSTQELKYKRLKVGHACYVCRSKKIKCDGLRPCMQCKARGRYCVSSNPETQQTEIKTANTSEAGLSDRDDSNSHGSHPDSDDESILFSRSRKFAQELKQYPESWTVNTVQKASENFQKIQRLPGLHVYPSFGSFVRWREEAPLPIKYSTPIEMPSSEMQMHMIDLFFETRYKITPMIPKRLFYQQLRTKGPLITPFLLNAIYCAVSGYSTLPDVPPSSVFFTRAKRLLDDFMDTPRVGTVAALCLLSLYEPRPSKSRDTQDQHCRSWMFSGMAFRMCLELGMNYDTPHSRADMPLENVEMYRRVFWSCYCLDKMQSFEWERLWSIPSSLAKTALPQVLPDDDEEESSIILAYEQKIRLCLIAEEGLQIRASFAIRDDIQDTRFQQQLDEYRAKILKWRENLKSPEIWGLHECKSVEEIIAQPKSSPALSYLHIVYYFMLIETLFCVPNVPKRCLEHRIYASHLTKSVDTIVAQPAMIIRFEFLAHATIAALRVHASYLNDSDADISRQSWGFFHQCVDILKKFQKHAIIPECSAVLINLPKLCQISLNNPCIIDDDCPTSSNGPHASNCNVSPPVETKIPPTVASINFHNGISAPSQLNNGVSLPQQQQQQQPHSMMIQSQLQGQQQLNDIPNGVQNDIQTNVRNDSQALQQAMYPTQLVDPFRTDIATVLSIDQQIMQSVYDSSLYNSLSAFGSTIGIDFGDRRQLWDYALQDFMNNQQYDVSSTATSPESPSAEIAPYNGNNDWSNNIIPNADFVWPGPIHSPPQHQLHMPQVSHPSPVPILTVQPQQSTLLLQKQLEESQFQQQFNSNMLPSPHLHQQQEMNYAYPNTNTNTTQSYVQQPQHIHHQIPSPVNYTSVSSKDMHSSQNSYYTN